MKNHPIISGCAGCSCLLISPFLHATLQPMDDQSLTQFSGQSGVTIEMTSELSIGQLEYKDEGRLQINNIHLGGANRSHYFGKDWGAGSHSGTRLDGLQYLLDVLADGDLVLSAFIDPGLGGGVVDFGLTTGEIRLANAAGDQSATLINSISMAGLATQFRMRIDSTTSVITLQSQMGIADLDVDAEPLGFGVRNMVIANNTYLQSLNEWGASALSLPDVQLPVEIAMVAQDDGLNLTIKRFNSDMVISELLIGGTNIGAVTLDDVNLNGINMLVYGHP
ncbi:DUF6160 family protein [Thalassolituus sp. LLYu03]|uniref:DUF6160 family protein n=1 Tax=Thalassolituus sp. LLYu03 TaxID=3421656 RepID=UPI003D2B09FA